MGKKNEKENKIKEKKKFGIGNGRGKNPREIRKEKIMESKIKTLVHSSPVLYKNSNVERMEVQNILPIK